MVSKQLKAKVQEASDKELSDLLDKENHDSPNWRCIFDEIQRRQFLKIGKTPWWQHAINFILVLGAIAAVLAAYLTWIQVKSSGTHSPPQQMTTKK